jgi:coproporphyrinogen III oxidase
MKIMDFVREMKGKATKELLEIAGDGNCVERTYTFKVGHSEITTIRGGGIEKAAISRLTINGVKLPGTDEEVDPTVYQMEVYPENPYCPMGHFNAEWTHGDTGPYYMNLDLFPAVRVEEDLEYMKQAMDAVADKFGKDRTAMREGLDIQYNMEHWSFPLATNVGCKLIGLEEEDLDFFITAYRTFFDAYCAILRKRKDTPFMKKEVRSKHERNGKWLEYIAFKDGAVKMAKAYDMPAEMLIGVTFPPSAVF